MTTPAPAPGSVEFGERLHRIRDEITLPANFTLIVERDKALADGRWYFQIDAYRPDTYTGQMGHGRGRKAYLSAHATDSELIQCAFGLLDAYVHHEAREGFLWKGRRVFGPHIDVHALWEVAERYDARPTAAA